MQSFSKVLITALIGSFLLLSQQVQACARCDAIEKKRAEEQAKKGPQPDQYYDDEYKKNITQEKATNSTEVPNTKQTNGSSVEQN